MRRAGCALAAVLLALVAGCSAAPGNEPSGPSSAAADLLPDSSSEDRIAVDTAGDAVWADDEPALRTADAAGPFGRPDLWIGAGRHPRAIVEPRAL